MCEPGELPRTPLLDTVWKIARGVFEGLFWRHARQRNGTSGSVLTPCRNLQWGLSGISKQFLEGEFCELRLYGVLRSSLRLDRKSTRLNSSHANISYAV